jgi:hypothetical protein
MMWEGAPDFQQLWQRSHTARKGGKVCDSCKDPIEPGQRYTDWGYLVDGKFERTIVHEHSYRYPSGCPKIRERDLAEMRAEQEQSA